MENTLRSQIEEEIRTETMKLDTRMTPEKLTRYVAERRAFKQDLYHLGKPLWNRIVWRAINVLSLDFGNATIMRSSSGEADVWIIIAECIPRTYLDRYYGCVWYAFLVVGYAGHYVLCLHD